MADSRWMQQRGEGSNFIGAATPSKHRKRSSRIRDAHYVSAHLYEVAFVNEEEAPRAFPVDTSARWGNGLTTRGTLVVMQWCAADATR